MCGLGGIAGDVSTKEEKFFKELLIFNSVRGMDSTGAGCISRHPSNGSRHNMKIAKCSGTFVDLFDRKSFDKLFHGINCCYIGHNRYKTVGDATDKNAHPFQFPDIMGAHNGTLDRLNKNRLEAGNQFDTDSEAIFNTIQIHGIEETIKRIDNTEAYALTWYDAAEHTINLIRNSKRSLYYTLINQGKTLAWASESGILQAALYRNDLIPDDKKVFELLEDVWLSWKIPDKIEAFEEPKRKKLEGRVPSWAVKKTYYHPTGGTTSTSQFTDDDLETEYGGLFTGQVPKRTSVTKEVVVTKVEPTNVVALPSPKNPKVMNVDDVKRLRSFGDAARKGLIPNQNETILKYNGDTTKIYRRIKDGKWIKLSYNGDPNSPEPWSRMETVLPPSDLPFTLLDINARHQFKHVGRKKRKKIYYKGFNGHPLDRDSFESYMQCGCINCMRIPEWGNYVAFISEEHDFLCEYCVLQPNLLEEMVALNKRKVVN